MSKVIWLGKARHGERPAVGRFVDLGGDRQVEIWERRDLLAADPAEVGVVLAKSHYFDRQVRAWLIRSAARVINRLDASESCRTRSRLAATLAAASVAVPGFFVAGSGQRAPVASGDRLIAKPDSAGEHSLEVIDAEQLASIAAGTFVQRYVEPESTMKVYVIGELRHGQLLEYEGGADAIASGHQPRREDLEALPEPVDCAVSAVAAATGLEVFNVDLVLGEGRWLVVDVNPFPGFERVPDAPQALWDLVDRRLSCGR